MRLQLTNEQLALFFDEDLKGDTISHGSRKYKIKNPILEINGLYADEIEYELSETPISTEYNNTVLLTSIPMEYGVVYDSDVAEKVMVRYNGKEYPTDKNLNYVRRKLKKNPNATIHAYITKDTIYILD